jgi:Pentapeptide repeats (8 copies)
MDGIKHIFSSWRTSHSPESLKPPDPGNSLARQPFKITQCHFRGADGLNNKNIAKDVARALQDRNSPETAITLLEMVFDSCSEYELNKFILNNLIEIRAVNEKVINGLSAKGIAIRLEGDGTIKTIRMTGEAVIDASGIHQQILDTWGSLPNDLANIIVDYLPHQPRITHNNIFKTIFRDMPKARWRNSEWQLLFQAASDQGKIHIVNFALDTMMITVGEIRLCDLNFEGLNLSGLRLTDGHFINVNLRNTNLSKAKFRTVRFSNSPIHTSTNLEHAEITRSNFTNSPIKSGAVISGAKFHRVTFDQSPIESGTVMHGTAFIRIKLIKSQIGQPCKTTAKPTFLDIEMDKESRPLPSTI